MKNVVRLENYYTPWELERAIGPFVDYYNHRRCHAALGNVTPADMYSGRQQEILSRREQIKHETLERRKRELEESGIAAQTKGGVSFTKRGRLFESL